MGSNKGKIQNKFPIMGRTFIGVILQLILSPQVTVIAHPVNVPGSTSVTRISKFPFYQKIVNPCGVSIGVPTESTLRDSPSIFTRDFVTAMGIAINLTMDALDDLERTTRRDSVSCDGVALVSLPPTTSLIHLNELKTMTTMYRSGIYLIAHLHLVTLDRGGPTDPSANSNTDNSADNDIGDNNNSQQILCENESQNYVPLVEELTRRLENVMCTAMNSANLEQRASFRRPLEQLEATKLYRYHGACTSLQTRDCIVLHHARKLLRNYQKKFRKLSLQFQSATTTHRSSSNSRSPAGANMEESVDNNQL